MYKNQLFVFAFSVIIVYNIHKLMFLDEWNRNFYELADISPQYRTILILLVLLNLCISTLVEYLSTSVFPRWWYKDRDKNENDYKMFHRIEANCRRQLPEGPAGRMATE